MSLPIKTLHSGAGCGAGFVWEFSEKTATVGEREGGSVLSGNLVRRVKFLDIVGRTACPEKRDKLKLVDSGSTQKRRRSFSCSGVLLTVIADFFGIFQNTRHFCRKWPKNHYQVINNRYLQVCNLLYCNML